MSLIMLDVSLKYRTVFLVQLFHFLLPVLTKPDKLFNRKIPTFHNISVHVCFSFSRIYVGGKLTCSQTVRSRAILTVLTGGWTRHRHTHRTMTRNVKISWNEIMGYLFSFEQRSLVVIRQKNRCRWRIDETMARNVKNCFRFNGRRNNVGFRGICD